MQRRLGLLALLFSCVVFTSRAHAGTAINVFPGFLNFDVPLNSSQSETFNIQNLTDETLSNVQLQASGYSNDFMIQDGGCSMLAPHASCTVWVYFRPTVRGLQHMTLEITSGIDFETVEISASAY